MKAKVSKMGRTLRVALVGGGIGGLTAALALARCGCEVDVFEQANELREVGAGLGISPNAIKVLRALGLEHEVRTRGFESEATVGRDWTTAQPLFRVDLMSAAEARYGATHVQIHRADLLDLLANAVGQACRIHLNSRCATVCSTEDVATILLSNGQRMDSDLVVGCDGIHSSIRSAMHGADEPRFTGNMCWRAQIPADELPRKCVPPNTTIWRGPGGHIVTFYVRSGALLNIVAVREVVDWIEESWSVAAQASELVDAYPGVHESLRMLLERAQHCFKWGLFDRDPLTGWSMGRITLLGDAAHPMLPFLGQGAAMAIEDAYVLARQLARSPDNVQAALKAYEAERIPRTTAIQLAAREQAKVLHLPDRTAELKIDWLYSYDPTLVEPVAA